MTNQHDRADIRDMLVVHEAFRRAYGRMPGLVLTVTPGDTARAAVVADHIQMIEEFLHLHHKGEDVLLWPKLAARAPHDLFPALELMDKHHEQIDGLLAECSSSLARWRRNAGASDRDELARALRALAEALTEHLAVEEAEVLPIVDQYVTAAEWHELGDHAINGLPKKKLPIIFGMLASLAEPAVVTLMLSTAPLVPRIIMPVLGPRAFASHARKVYGPDGF
ncbi:hemerythrin domain-containing protein [Actinacidiphila sp. bgisy160]|uniref:hemerythrin domain-containing protein n=1 Tax=Actinacidiphila sp. bgisy160 TaxID=3413796 RepID=UPI003D7647E0